VHRFLRERVELGKPILVRLMPDDDLYLRLKDIVKDEKIERGVFLSAIGSLKDVVFRNLKWGARPPIDLDKTEQVEEEGPFELLSLEGNIFPMGTDHVLHAHVILGTPEGKVIGGHLFGARVCTTVELVLAEIKDSTVIREHSGETGLNELRQVL